LTENNGKWKTTNDEFRGYSKAKFEEIHSDVKEIKDTLKEFHDGCGEKHGDVDDRVDKLEEAESNRSAVQKKMNIVYGIIISVVTAGANVAFKVFK